MLRPLQWIYSVYAIVLFTAILLLVIPLAFVAALFGPVRGGNFIYKVMRIWGFTWYFLVGIRHRNIYDGDYDPTGHYIFVANHTSYLDIPPIMMALRQPVRVLAKYEMSKIPLFGIVYKSITILVDRRDADKRAASLQLMKDFLRRHISIFIFPEGTFNETGQPLKDFYDGAFRIAIETATPVKPIVFPDNLQRLHYSSIFSFTPGISRAVFLPVVPVAGLTPEDLPTLKQQVYAEMEGALKRYRQT